MDNRMDLPKATGQGGPAELANAGGHLLGSPAILLPAPVPVSRCHRGCAGAWPEEDCSRVTGVSLSGSSWECTPPTGWPLSSGCFGGPEPPPLAARWNRPAEALCSRAPQVEPGISLKPQLSLASSLALLCPLPSTGLTCEHPLSASQAHPSAALLSGDSAQEGSRGEM